MVVNYANQNDLKFKLAGVDTVISTVTGNPQIMLIDAAAAVGVERFAPAEFEGQSSLRPQADPLDRGKLAALGRLQHYSQYGMQFTSFVCGILYDRFAPGGMAAAGIGLGSGVAAEGDYVMDIRNLRAQIPRYNANNQAVRICMTSAQDVGRFVVAAIDLNEWPRELRMRGERMTVLDVVGIAETMRGMQMSTSTDLLSNSMLTSVQGPTSNARSMTIPRTPYRGVFTTRRSHKMSNNNCKHIHSSPQWKAVTTSSMPISTARSTSSPSNSETGCKQRGRAKPDSDGNSCGCCAGTNGYSLCFTDPKALSDLPSPPSLLLMASHLLHLSLTCFQCGNSV